MEGRSPLGVLVALTRSTDPAREEELSRWYDEVHIPDIVGAMGGSLRHPIRWRNPAPSLADNEPRFLATYETDQEDLEAVFAAANREHFRCEERGRLHECLHVIHPGSSIYRRLAPAFGAGPGQPVQGLLLVITDCADPTREEEFNRWYNETHVPDILNTGLFHTAYRYEKVRYSPGRGKYLAMYETDREPAEAVRELTEEYRPRWRAQGRYVDTLQLHILTAFQRL